MTRQEGYRIVIEAEIRSQNLYKALAKSFRNAETTNVFNELVVLEENHETKVRAAFSREFPHQELFIADDLSMQLSGIDLSDPKEVLQFAIYREEVAEDIYQKMAAESLDPEIKDMMLQFAAEELDHKTLLLAEIQRIQGAMTWFDSSELTGFMED
ncbi:MAG: ferritin family protein [Candidatus Cloacimonas sp.]|jgi:rubrerythrin|nr:ferritin family protein [Candidatus Cloacimonas sp.]